MIDNKLYLNQFYLLACISIVTFKVGMLPSLICSIDAYERIFVISIMMLIELMMLFIVYEIIKNGSIYTLNISERYRKLILILILISLSIKLIIFTGEGSFYIKQHLFENAQDVYVLVPLFITIGYLAYKGINNIARVSEIMIAAIIIALVFNVLFASLDIEKDAFLNMSLTENTCVIIDKYIIWFGDFTPFLMAKIVKPKKHSTIKMFGILGIVLIPIILELAFILIFKEGGEYIEYAFSKLAIYNQFSLMVGNFDTPTIIAFLISMFIKLALMLFAIVDILAYFFQKRELVSIITIISFFIGCICVNEKSEFLRLATSNIRYLVFLIEYLTPMVIFVLFRINKQKQQKGECSCAKNG